ncbi:hypothetical protein [Rossellomorea marisflavi]|uniref:hypothetical protein n=1 Tax=Rossellomorea marisflavi TaxID=189381 RepID=UPI003F9F9CF7
MNYENLYLLDKWGESFKENKEFFQSFLIEQGLFKENVAKTVLFKLNCPESLHFVFTVSARPTGQYHFKGIGVIPGTQGSYFDYDYRAELQVDNGEIKVKRYSELVILFDEGESVTANPAVFVSETIDEMIQKAYEEGHPDMVPQPNLMNHLLEDIMNIQMKVMEKEKDTKGIIDIQEQFNSMRKGEA